MVDKAAQRISNAEPTPSRVIDAQTLVDSLQMDMGREVAYPARSPLERAFIEYDEDEYKQDQAL